MLLDRAFGPARTAKTCERLRAGRLPARGLSLVARTAGFGGGAVVGGQLMGEQLTGGQLMGGQLMGPRLDATGRDPDGATVGTVRLWHVDAGGVAALMLGPLAVAASARRLGVGARLMEEAIARARALGHDAIVLVGDAPYYARFGFERRHTLGLHMPGPVEAARFLGLELTDGALAAASGLVRPTGAADLAARRFGHRRSRSRRAA